MQMFLPFGNVISSKVLSSPSSSLSLSLQWSPSSSSSSLLLSSQTPPRQPWPGVYRPCNQPKQMLRLRQLWQPNLCSGGSTISPHSPTNQPWYHDAVKDGAVSCGSSVWLKLVLHLHINKSRTQESTLPCYQRHHHHEVKSGHHVQCWSVSGCDTSDEWIPNRDEETQGPAEETKGRQPAVLNFSPLFSEMYCVV